jgi:hypothetical protein
MGGVLAGGGAIGAFAGVELFRWLRLLGQADLVVALSYLLFLGAIGTLMLNESLGEILRRRRGEPPRRAATAARWLYGLPLKDALPQVAALHQRHPAARAGRLRRHAVGHHGRRRRLHPGAGHALCPAHARRGRGRHQPVPDHHHHGLTGVLQAGRNQTVDIVLATLLLLGGVVGAQLGARASGRFRAEELRALLALIVLLVGLRMGLGPVRPARRALRPDGGRAAMIPPAQVPLVPPPAPVVSAALTDTKIRVNSDFRGARIVLYGAVFDPENRPSDVVVIVRGPEQPVRIARKVRSPACG